MGKVIEIDFRARKRRKHTEIDNWKTLDAAVAALMADISESIAPCEISAHLTEVRSNQPPKNE